MKKSNKLSCREAIHRQRTLELVFFLIKPDIFKQHTAVHKDFRHQNMKN